MKRVASLGLGKLAILATLASVLFVLVAFGQNMFSSGPLSVESRKNVTRGGVQTHAQITSCSACHAPAWSSDTMATRCMECHDNIRAQLDGQQPMHGMLAQGQDCMSCHTEHKGPHASLTSFAKFDHDFTAFKLVGKHKQADCASCHTDKTYQGTPQTCVACHADPAVHKDKFGTDCMSCHTPNTWQTASIKTDALTAAKFNHDLTGFKLTGKHAVADCKSCHVNNTFKGTATSCVSCHAEPVVHKDKFGTECRSCHSTNDWKSVALNKDVFTSLKFDHDTTAFKLTGKHKNADCKSCHTTNTFKGTPQTCVSCHAEPISHKPHAKTFGTKCADCHSTADWKGATLVKHTFPMNYRTKNGKNSACSVCHPATINFTSTTPPMSSPSYATYTCYGCHHHTPAKEAARHARRKVANLEACATCHKTGRSGGDKRRTALDEASVFDLCLGCPDRLDISAARSACTDLCLGQISNPSDQLRLQPASERHDNLARAEMLPPATNPALRLFDLRDPRFANVWR